MKTILFSAERAEKRIDGIFSLSVLLTERKILGVVGVSSE
jgi:hypothetical protein